jgi:hypothetical protein
LVNGIPAARSLAFDISLMGTGCFYRTLYYNLLDRNQLEWVLELSAPAYVDSVFYEQISASGQLLKTWGAVKVNAGDRTYKWLVAEAPGGTTYWRARIKLKTGAIVYTDISSVLTSGKQLIVFYPNPAGKNQSLVYVLQQGVPAASRLQLFDISGRLLKQFSEMPGNIDVSTLASGMVIYKLMSADGKLLERGKLIIQ